jgi:outer membrane protein TolC
MNQSASSLLVSLIALAMFAHEATAEGLPPLLEAARAHNPEIQAAQAEWRAAQARIPQARSLPNPTAAFETMGIGVKGSASTALLNQSFPWPGTLGRRESVASLQARARWHEVQAIELRLAGRIRSTAYEIAYLKRETEIVRSTVELYLKQEDFLEEVARGGGEVADLLRIEMESGLLGDELSRLGEEIRRQTSEMEALVGRAVAEEEVAALRLPASKPGEPPPELAAELAVRNPTLQALATRTDAARAGVSLARLETFPDFMLGAGYRRVVDPGMAGATETMDEGVVMFSISLPIWGNKNRGIRDEASAMLEAAQGEYEKARRMLVAQVNILRSRHRDAARRAALFDQTLLPKARQSHDAIESSYRAGRASLLDLLEARRQLLETETGYWRAITDLHINRAEINALFGTRIELRQP